MKIIVYTKNQCPYCDAAKELLDWNNLNYIEKPIELCITDKRISMNLENNYESPIIYIDDEYLGGYQELVNLITRKEK